LNRSKSLDRYMKDRSCS